MKQVVVDREKVTPTSGKISTKNCHFGQNIDLSPSFVNIEKQQKWRLGKDESNRFLPFSWKSFKV